MIDFYEWLENRAISRGFAARGAAVGGSGFYGRDVQPEIRINHCQQCGHPYSWDQNKCQRCNLPYETSRMDDRFKQLVASWNNRGYSPQR